jgi:hypothetical protein
VSDSGDLIATLKICGLVAALPQGLSCANAGAAKLNR